MVVGEDTGDGDDSGQDDTKVQVVIWGLLVGGGLDTVGEEAEDGSQPQETGEPGEEILTELDPFWRGGGRGQLVQAILLNTGLGLGGGQTVVVVCAKPFVQLFKLDFMNIEFKLFLKILCLCIFLS